jgi:flavin-dependent dehydrogenase
LDATSTTTPPWVATGDIADHYDVVVLGGGLAGLCLGLQLRQQLPTATVAVLERATFPNPDAAFKVGESSSEVAEWYWSRTLGLADHMADKHVRKLGLRYICAADDEQPFADRVEVGSRTWMFSRTYQVDRGRFENELAEFASAAGAELYDGTRVVSVDLDLAGDAAGEAGYGNGNGNGSADPYTHTVTVERDGQRRPVRARWVVDATGRRSLLKRQLDLAEDIPHDVNAVWWRHSDMIKVDELGEGESWRRQVPEAIRWMSTTHLLGTGYWVWLIPLSSGSISVGIVADPRWVPFEEIATYDKAKAWLRAHEPELAHAVEVRDGALQDFKALKNFAYGCKQVFSADRWALTGVSGVFLDPLYSPGSDFISLANMYITDLIVRDMTGDDSWADRAQRADAAFLRLFRNALPTWLDQYGLMGSAQVFPAKVAWDTLVYFLMLGHNFIAGGTYDLDLHPVIGPTWERFHRLNHHLQWFLRRWDELDDGDTRSGYLDMSNDTVRWFNALLMEPVGKDELPQSLQQNLDFLERLAVRLMAGAAAQVGHEVDADAIDPYTFGMGATDPGAKPSPYRDEPLPVHPRAHTVDAHADRVFALRPAQAAADAPLVRPPTLTPVS